LFGFRHWFSHQPLGAIHNTIRNNDDISDDQDDRSDIQRKGAHRVADRHEVVSEDDNGNTGKNNGDILIFKWHLKRSCTAGSRTTLRTSCCCRLASSWSCCWSYWCCALLSHYYRLSEGQKTAFSEVTFRPPPMSPFRGAYVAMLVRQAPGYVWRSEMFVRASEQARASYRKA